MRTSQYYFELTSGKHAPGWVLRTFVNARPNADQGWERYLHSQIVAYAAVPWAVDLIQLSELGNDGNSRILAISRDGSDADIVHLTAEVSKTVSMGKRTEYSERAVLRVDLDSRKSWAVKAYECATRRVQQGRTFDVNLKGEIEYRFNNGDDLPVPNRHINLLMNPDGSMVTSRVEYAEWQYGAVIPESAFRLSAFGLPDAIESARQGERTLPAYLMLLASAALVGLLALATRRLAARHRHRSTAA